ncbi:hypothetical protein L0Y69_02080 [bacterium]|nr:hypothetical protein [bacterium]
MILILNPGAVKRLIPDISRNHEIIYKKEMAALSSEERGKVEAIITGQGGGPVTKEMLEALPSLKVVGIVGASLRKYNPGSIIKKNIPIVNASDTYAESVAEFALMQALVGIKNASLSHDAMRTGAWGIRKEKFLKKVWLVIKGILPKEATAIDLEKPVGGRNLRGLRVGIVGYGAVAREFIRLLTFFGCEIRVFSEYLSEEKALELGVKKGDLAHVLNSDIVSLHRGLSDRTRHSFGKEEIALLKAGTILLNTSRGAIIDEKALTARLMKGDIFACLDVFEEEPLSANSPLRKLPNVFLTSHIGGVTKEIFSKSPGAVVKKILAVLSGEQVDSLITSEEMLRNMT